MGARDYHPMGTKVRVKTTHGWNGSEGVIIGSNRPSMSRLYDVNLTKPLWWGNAPDRTEGHRLSLWHDEIEVL